MINTSAAESIGKEIFVYKNFLSEKELEEYNNEILKIKDDEWISSEWSLDPERELMWYSKKNNKLLDLREKISDLLSDDLFLGNADFFIKIAKGGTWGAHSDNYDFKFMINKSMQYKDGDNFYEQDVPFYGLIVYFNDFEGGEIYYTEQDIEYKPSAGDLIIHSADDLCTHLVKEVKSEARYSFSANIRRKIKIPIGENNV